MSEMTLAARLGKEVHKFGSIPLSAPVWEKARTCLLDSLGLSQIARNEATAAATCDLALPVEKAGFMVWARGQRSTLSDAVTANAVTVHAHFHDDSEPASWCHPGSLISPVAVGATESVGGTVELALRALVAGYSMLNWLGCQEEVAHALITRGFRTSPVLGTIGAAAAASVAMGLDPEQTTNALMIATSITGGTLAPLRAGSDEWRVENAHAARGGLLAAQMARRGVQGAQTSLEGPKGLLQSFAGMTEIPEGWKGPINEEAILRIYVKPWATLGDNMAAVRAARLVYEDGLDLDQVEKVEVTLWRKYVDYPGTNYKGPFRLPIQGLASTTFSVSAMLALGDMEYDVSLERREDPALLNLISKMEVIPHDGSKLDSQITVFMKDGTQRVRSAFEAPKNWLYHDAARSTQVFEGRMLRDKREAGTGLAIASSFFGGELDQDPVSTLLEKVCC